ncbi:MAG: redoxin domain-containing protein, partial [Vulcanimicrobiaceae bacterium]
VVVNVWATWCPPCQQETPDLVSAYKKLHSADVVFISIDSSERPELVRAFAAAKSIQWTQAVDEKRTFLHAYDVRYFPTTYVIDPQGILRSTYIDTITPKLLAGFVTDAQAGRDSVVTSSLQKKIDALLAPAAFNFSGPPAKVLATVEHARKTMDKVDAMVGDSDPATNPVDLPSMQREENALRVRTIAALGPLATTTARRATLAQLEGARDLYLGEYAKSMKEYRMASTLDPKNGDSLDGLSMSARYAKQYPEMLRADKAQVAMMPDSVPALVGLAIDEGGAKQYAASRATFDRAIALASKKANAPYAKPKEIRMLAWAHLYYGRMEAKAGDSDAARRQFALAMTATVRLPKKDSRYTIYMEQAQEETVALDLARDKKNATAISLAPWTGPELPNSSPDTAKYRLVVTGPAGKTVTLRAADLPKGWIASFCLDRICAPLRVTTTLPDSGVKVIEFQVVPPEARLLARVPSVRVIATVGSATSTARTIALR